jgi:pyruvate,water dikinase
VDSVCARNLLQSHCPTISKTLRQPPSHLTSSHEPPHRPGHRSRTQTNPRWKARALAELRHADLPVPPWFVILPTAFEASANGTTLENPASIKASPELASHLQKLTREFFGECPVVAVRSSAIDEDGSEHSFAGQLDSFLFVEPSSIAGKVAQVWKSGFSERILAYRRERNLPGAPQPPSVLVQKMIDADTAGVAFGADPVSGRRGIVVVSACWGLGSGLVSGECDADLFHVDRTGNIILCKIATKTHAHQRSASATEGVQSIELPKTRAEAPCLTDDQVRRVADLARAAAKHFGRPQDIEWALKNGELYLLQSRPITSLASLADPDGALNIWDNSNIAESYSGVTTPLTFSFARRIYEEVYRQFCRVMKVRDGKIADHSTTFRRMLGLIRGRVYYNLVSWYRVLALLPGFKVNRRFMEQMMGVKKGIPEELLAEIAPPSTSADRIRDGIDLVRTLAGLIGNYLQLPGMRRAFYTRLDDALRPQNPPLEELRTDELAAHYHELEHQLLTRWDAPLVNDFFAMIFHGVLRSLSEKWCDHPSLHNDLIAGDGDIISAEPPKRIRQMAELASPDAALVHILSTGTTPEIRTALQSRPVLAKLYTEYLDKYGDRCLEELKLETLTLHDDPLILSRAIGRLATRLASTSSQSKSATEPVLDLRGQAEAQAKTALSGHPIREAIFNWVVKQTRDRVRDRENLRFERTRLFGRVRRILVELGKRFAADDLLADPRDIFYLSLEEILGAVEGTTVTRDLKSLVTQRRAEFAEYQATPAPPDRFETRGSLAHLTRFTAPTEPPSPATTATGEALHGIACYPGIIRAKARVITDPRNAVIEPGEILVAPRTDPGWIMLFASAAGLLVEHGSILSHSAIVAREMGIPTIVAIPGITEWAKTGDLLELDGSTGTVRKIDSYAK